MQRLSIGNRFNTAAGIAHQLNDEQGKDLFKRSRTKSALCRDKATHQQKE